MSKKPDIGEVIALQRFNDALKANDIPSARLWWGFLKTEHKEIVEAARPLLDGKVLKQLELPCQE